MKTIIAFLLLVIPLISVAQNNEIKIFKSPSILKAKTTFETDRKDRIITINNNEISISNFSAGTKTFYLNINRKETNKEFDFNENCTYYYCTTKESDITYGYRKAIIVVSEFKIWMALFVTELDVFKYEFSLNI